MVLSIGKQLEKIFKKREINTIRHIIASEQQVSFSIFRGAL